MVFRILSFDLHLHHGELSKLPVIFFRGEKRYSAKYKIELDDLTTYMT